MNTETSTETTEPETTTDEPEMLDQESDEVHDAGEVDGAAETFSRDVVDRLRHENARYRQRAQQTDDYATRLHTELVRATGRLTDPTDLPFNESHLDDPDALTAALDTLLADKPHLALRKVAGDVGQGWRGPAAAPFSLIDTLKGLT